MKKGDAFLCMSVCSFVSKPLLQCKNLCTYVTPFTQWFWFICGDFKNSIYTTPNGQNEILTAFFLNTAFLFAVKF